MQVSRPAGQTLPQPPQLESSPDTTVQSAPASETQKVSPAVEQVHLAPKHLVIELGQTLPQPPQLRSSASSVVQSMPPSAAGHAS